MLHKSSIYLVATFAFLLLSSLASAQSTAPACGIQVTSPSPGREVANGIFVEGTAELPPGHHLWVFARRTNFRPRWWPQSEGFPDLVDGKWSVYASFGNRNDIGWDFDVIAAVFAPDQHILLEGYFDEASSKGYPPILLPAAVCASNPLAVKKTRHDLP